MADDQFDDDQIENSDPDSLKDLRAKAKEAKAAKADAEAARKELAFLKAGIPDDGVGGLFRKAYDGDMTDDAIKAAAAEVGIGKEEPTPQGQPPEAPPGNLREPPSLAQLAEQEAQRRVTQVTAGATAPPPESVDEQLAATQKLPWHRQAEAVRQVMVKNGIWADTTALE